MARVEEVERRLTEWADWKRAEGRNEGTAGTVQPPTETVRQMDFHSLRIVLRIFFKKEEM